MLTANWTRLLSTIIWLIKIRSTSGPKICKWWCLDFAIEEEKKGVLDLEPRKIKYKYCTSKHASTKKRKYFSSKSVHLLFEKSAQKHAH